MKRTHIAILAAGLLASAGLGTAIAANGPEQTGGERHSPRVADWIARMDTNGDGVLQKSEALAFQEKLFDEGDTDKDGQLTEAEIRAQFAARRDGRFAEHFARLDADKSGTLSPEELKGRAPKLFERADADKDGVVTEEELRAAFTHRGPAAK